VIKFVKNIINRLYGFIFDRRMLDQFISIQVIKRTQEEYSLHFYGKHEVFTPPESQVQNCIKLPRFSLALTPQALPKPYYFYLPSAGIYREEIIDPNNPNRVLLENFPDVSNPFENKNYPIRPWNKFHIKHRMKEQTYDADKVFLFAGRWWGNYFHFVIDYCIRYNDLKDNGIIDEDTKILFPGQIKSWQREYFSLLDINTDNIHITSEKPLFVQNCLIASTRRDRFLVSKAACRTFSHKMINSIERNLDVSCSDRVYISRRDSSRKIINEIELFDMLKEHNFNIVKCENLTVSEQIRLFSTAKLVVAAHGAGVTNIIYSNRPIVIELIPNDAWVWGYFAVLAARLGCDYQAISGTYTTEVLDYEIDIEELKLVIETKI